MTAMPDIMRLDSSPYQRSLGPVLARAADGEVVICLPFRDELLREAGSDGLQPARAGDLVATGRVVKAGRRVSLADVELHDAQGTLVAVGRGLFANPVVAP